MLSNRFDKDEKRIIILIDAEKRMKKVNYQKSQQIRNRRDPSVKCKCKKHLCVNCVPLSSALRLRG